MRRPVEIATIVAFTLVLGCKSTPPAQELAPEPSRPAAELLAVAAPAPIAEPEPRAVPARPARATQFVDDEALGLRVAARVKTGSQPKSVAVSPDGEQLWVCNFGYANRKNVYVYDSATLEWIGMAEFKGNAVEVAFAPDGSRAYVSNFARGVVEVIDRASFEVVAETEELGLYPKVIAVAPDGERVYVANWGSRSVAVVDAHSYAIVESLATGRRPRGMAVAPDGTLFVNAMWDHLVYVFARSGASTIATCEYPRHAVLDAHDPALFVTCSGEDRLRWHDLGDGRTLGEVEVGDNPRSFGLSDDGRWAATADFDGSSVTLVDLFGGRRHTTAVPKSDRIVGLAVAHGPDLRVFATSWGNNQLLELRVPEPGSENGASALDGEIRRN